MKLKWHFPTTDGGEDDGINDPLRENFEGDYERFLAREILQNSNDARMGRESVHVRFERILLESNCLPGRDAFTDALKRAMEYSKGQEGSEEFYQSAIKMIERDKIPVLKISDYNTTGLNGSDKDKDSEWYRLIRATGASSMSGDGGGSFGIGKGAAYAASALRMVFYSTVNKNGEHVFQGKSRINSFILDDDTKRGIGLFGIEEERGVSSVRTDENIPDEFKRTEQGTDIYIIGYLTEEDDWRKRLIQSVLSNFWAAIHYGDLVVAFSDEQSEEEEIDDSNLENYLLKFSDQESDTPLHFYRALTDGQKIERDLPLLGKCSLFVQKSEGYPKRVQMMRKSKMVIKTTAPSAFRVLGEPFAAVFLCNNDMGNKKLRALEPPAHNEWDPDRDKNSGKQIRKELMDFIRETLKSLASDNKGKPEEIPNLNYYLPSGDEPASGSGTTGSQSDENVSPVESAVEKGADQRDPETESKNAGKRSVAVTKKTGGGFSGTGAGSGRSKGKGKGKIVSGGSTPGTGNQPVIDLSKIEFRAREFRESDQIWYQAVIRPLNNEQGDLKLVAVGEDDDYALDIEQVQDVAGGTIAFEGSLLKNLNLNAGIDLRLKIKFQSNKRYAIGIKSK